MEDDEIKKDVKAQLLITRSLGEILEISDQRRRRINTAIAYCDRTLANNPNGAELMFLVTVKQILQGLDDGRATNTTEDKTDGR